MTIIWMVLVATLAFGQQELGEPLSQDSRRPAGLQDADILLAPYRGRPASALVRRLGAPQETLPASDGTVRQWRIAERNWTRVDGGITAHGSYGRSQAVSRRCVLAVSSNAVDEITDWRISGDADGCARILRWLR